MGLVAYDSSDDDEEPPVEAPKAPPSTAQPQVKQDTDAAPASQPLQPAPAPPATASLAPVMGPSRPAAADALQELPEASPEPADAPGSPFTARRALLRDLTLPTVPDLDIPQSPPGTPPAALDALNRKFDNFLGLKRTKGVHFNERLAQSAALRNPGLMDKLMGFVGIETRFDEGDATDQYANALPRDLWDPSALPPWAYKGPLRKAQEKAHERPRGERVEFVGAADAAPVTGKRKSRFDA